MFPLSDRASHFGVGLLTAKCVFSFFVLTEAPRRVSPRFWLEAEGCFSAGGSSQVHFSGAECPVFVGDDPELCFFPLLVGEYQTNLRQSKPLGGVVFCSRPPLRTWSRKPFLNSMAPMGWKGPPDYIVAEELDAGSSG